MGGPRRWFDEHNLAVRKKFDEYRVDDATGWDATKGQDNRTLKEWYKQVEAGSVDGDWKSVTLQCFKSNIKRKSKEYVHTHKLDESGGGNNNARPDGASGETVGEEEVEDAADSDGEIEVGDNDGVNVSMGEAGNLRDEPVTNEVQGEVEFQHQDSGKSVVMPYFQWRYEVADPRGVKTIKIAILIVSPSGWYASLEQERGDYFSLNNGGKHFRMSLTGCPSINIPEVARDILTNSGVFGNLYNDPSPNVQHPAVSAAQTAYVEDDRQSLILEIPLLTACSKVVNVEGLTTKNSAGLRVLVQHNVPQVSADCTQK